MSLLIVTGITLGADLGVSSKY